ncbi:MAG: DmsE family decaheme c-type cytochrome [Burkholderiaceae bacterium]
MKTILKLLVAISFLIVCLGEASTAWSADLNLPDINGAAPSKAAIANEALKKDAVCTRCHDESETTPILSIYQTKHGVKGDPRTPACQSCHGDSDKHLKGNVDGKGRPAPDVVFKKGVYAVTDDKERANQCLTCHKGTKRTNWDGGKHQIENVACNDCHKVHQPTDTVRNRKTQTEVCFTCHKDQRADSHKISAHPINDGKVICSDCHNPHGSAGPKMLKKNTVTETCYTCHAEKRGPFLWEHQPVSEDCTNCHTPHGSNITPLLKSRAPFLCQECHDGPHNSKTPYAGSVGGIQNGLVGTATTPANPGSNQMGRACQNCHSMVHGSNSPAGALLQR